MLVGGMQTHPLQVSALLDFAAVAHPAVSIVSKLSDEPTFRYDYAGLARRTARLAHALKDLGVGAGDRVATLAWNTHRHLELMYAVPGIGAVLHTANPRLSDDQIIYVLDHGGAEILFLDAAFLPLVERIAPRLTRIRLWVLLGPTRTTPQGFAALSYEALIAADAAAFSWPTVDENSGAVLCYTSGTTGNPKGVLYSHRSIVLHALSAGLAGAMGVSAFDIIMPCSSLYHATGWGLPYIAPIHGCALVLPGDKFDPVALHALIEEEGVTFSTGVPTIWTAYLAHLDALRCDTPLRRVLIGGSAVPLAMFEAFRRHRTEVLQMWGMTETSPVAVAATPTPALVAATDGAVEGTLWSRQGRRMFGVALQIVDEGGVPVPADGETPGALQVRGPWIVQRYFRADADIVDANGWFDTGDIATIDALGYIRLTDRAKDVIKSGGEWVSSIDLENAAMGYTGVRIAAAFAIPHPKWDERPVLLIERHPEADFDAAAIIEFLSTRLVKWWLPDRVLFDEVPLTSTGKIDKKALRQRYHSLFTSES